MTKNPKTVFRDSGNGQFISKHKAACKSRNTWQKERCRVGIRNGNSRIAAIDRRLIARGVMNPSRSTGRMPHAWRKIEEHETLGRIKRKIDRIKERIVALSEKIRERN
jgi:hypothetical protein